MCPAPWQPALGVPRVPGGGLPVPIAHAYSASSEAEPRHGRSHGAGISAGHESERELWATQSPHLFCISEFTACKAAAEEPSHKTLFHKL